MSGITSTTPQIYLAQEAGGLILHQGANPQLAQADTRVLIVGGGVTGLTVSADTPRSIRHIAHILIM